MSFWSLDLAHVSLAHVRSGMGKGSDGVERRDGIISITLAILWKGAREPYTNIDFASLISMYIVINLDLDGELESLPNSKAALQSRAQNTQSKITLL